MDLIIDFHLANPSHSTKTQSWNFYTYLMHFLSVEFNLPQKCYEFKTKLNTDLSYKGVSKCYKNKPFILFYTFFDKNCAWISLDFLVQKNLDIFVDYLGYYFGSTA